MGLLILFLLLLLLSLVLMSLLTLFGLEGKRGMVGGTGRVTGVVEGVFLRTDLVVLVKGVSNLSELFLSDSGFFLREVVSGKFLQVPSL